jgi:hypothetical protein
VILLAAHPNYAIQRTWAYCSVLDIPRDQDRPPSGTVAMWRRDSRIARRCPGAEARGTANEGPRSTRPYEGPSLGSTRPDGSERRPPSYQRRLAARPATCRAFPLPQKPYRYQVPLPVSETARGVFLENTPPSNVSLR